MKQFLCQIMACVLVVASLSGCVARSAQPEESSSDLVPAVSSEAEQPETTPAEGESGTSSSEPEPDTAPLPALTEQERAIIDEDLRLMTTYFDRIETMSDPTELDQESVLFFCLWQAYRTKDLHGYYFEEQETEASVPTYLIPEGVVAETAERLLGYENFAATDSDRYVSESSAYWYREGHGFGGVENWKLAPLAGTPDGGIVCDITFFSPDDPDMVGVPSRTTRYTFNLLRLNGMPYLQLAKIEQI